ncbi:MAG TPA: class I SAM-dependent methyltransferase [Bacteroidota bacterium]
MATTTLGLSEALQEYVRTMSVRESSVLKQLRQETATLSNAVMQISPEQGQFMSLLVKLMHAERAIELGTFTGYSSLCVAQALPERGRLIACDVSEEWTTIARKYWKLAGVSAKIDLRLGPAADTIKRVASEKIEFDFAFIDADKENYITYFNLLLPLIKKGGLIAIDNVLWSGRVADPSETENDTESIRAFNEFIKQTHEVEISMVPIGDGLTLAMKK